MPQTILAILGIVLLSTTTMTLHATRVHLQHRAIARELQEMGSALALEVMEVIRSREFDQAVIDGSTSGSPADLAHFSYQNGTDHFSTGNACSVFDAGMDVCDDVDDFHAMAPAVLPFVLASDTVFFQVEVDVQYVDDTLARHNGRTFNKQVTVYVQDIWPSGRDPYLPAKSELSRVFSYDF